jgi:hypothetical protein
MSKPINSHEEIMVCCLAQLIPEHYYIHNGYYSFLPSPKKKPMQLDIFFPKLKLALEYNGRQHYSYNQHFFKNKEQFEYLKKCDRLKKRLCKELRITLITVDYSKTISCDYLKRRIIKVGRGEIFDKRYEAN